jgi:hypothetical protein
MDRNEFCQKLVEHDPGARTLYEKYWGTPTGDLPFPFLMDWSRTLVERYRAQPGYKLPDSISELVENACQSSDSGLFDLLGAGFFERVVTERDIRGRVQQDLHPCGRSRLEKWMLDYP